VLYCRGAADAARFADLQAALRRNLSDSAHMLRAARQRVDEAYAHFGRLCAEEDAGRARYWAGALLMQCSDACAYANGRYFARGLKAQREDLERMEVPAGFLAACAGAVRAKTPQALRAFCRDALRGTDAFVRGRAASAPAAAQGEALAGMVRESVSTFQKLNVCAQTGNEHLAFLSAVCLQDALDEMAREAGAPALDLLGAFCAQDLAGFAAHAQGLLARLCAAVEAAGGFLCPYASMDEFLADTSWWKTEQGGCET